MHPLLSLARPTRLPWMRNAFFRFGRRFLQSTGTLCVAETCLGNMPLAFESAALPLTLGRDSLRLGRIAVAPHMLEIDSPPTQALHPDLRSITSSC